MRDIRQCVLIWHLAAAKRYLAGGGVPVNIELVANTADRSIRRAKRDEIMLVQFSYAVVASCEISVIARVNRALHGREVSLLPLILLPTPAAIELRSLIRDWFRKPGATAIESGRHLADFRHSYQSATVPTSSRT